MDTRGEGRFWVTTGGHPINVQQIIAVPFTDLEDCVEFGVSGFPRR